MFSPGPSLSQPCTRKSAIAHFHNVTSRLGYGDLLSCIIPFGQYIVLLLLLLSRMNEELTPILTKFESVEQNGVKETTKREQYVTSFFIQV